MKGYPKNTTTESQPRRQLYEITAKSVKYHRLDGMQTTSTLPRSPSEIHRNTKAQRQKRVHNGSHLLSNIARFYNNPACSDVKVKVDGISISFYLHRLLLARSEVFEAMLLGHCWSDSRKSEILLEEAEFCLDYMDTFFRYFYTGEVDLNEENAIPLLVLANKYGIGDLEESCEIFVSSLVFNGTPIDQIIDWWTIAGQLNLKILREKCDEYIILNFDMVVRSDLFVEFDTKEVLTLLRERNLVVTSESSLYCAIWKWISKPERIDNVLENFKELTSYINFTMMTTEELVNIESTLPNNLKAVINGQLLNAFKFHSFSYDKRAKMELAKCNGPRLYTKSRGQSLSAGVALDSKLRPFLQDGVSYQVAIPKSLSEADRNNVRDWKLVFQETDESINLEVSTTTTASEQFGMIEASVLLYKKVNNITFVKGVMQFRIFQGAASTGKAGHAFSVLVPRSALEENDQCLFRLVTRHYHDKQSVRNILKLDNPQETINDDNRTE